MRWITVACSFCGWRGDGAHIADPETGGKRLVSSPPAPICGLCLARVNLYRLSAA